MLTTYGSNQLVGKIMSRSGEGGDKEHEVEVDRGLEVVVGAENPIIQTKVGASMPNISSNIRVMDLGHTQKRMRMRIGGVPW